MRDRTPTRALENGALRYGVYAEDGSLLRYEYLALEDDPTDPGTELSKATLLQDSTEVSLFGSAADRTVDDVFVGIAGQLKLIKSDMAAITLTVQDTNDKPIPEVLVQGILSESGQAVYTNASGVVTGYIGEGTQVIKVSGYADLVDYSETMTVVKGTTINKTIKLTTRNFLKITSSRSIKFSGNVSAADVTAVGGGGGGGRSGTVGSDDKVGGAGGGGGYCTVKENIKTNPNELYKIVIGSGGTAGLSYKDPNGKSGGTTTALGVTAKGGGGGEGLPENFTGYSLAGGIGNGNGGHNGYRAGARQEAENGHDGSVLGYASFTEMVRYGGGGAGGGYGYDIVGGQAFGAGQGKSAKANTGGGGGGGDFLNSSIEDPGNGGSGVVAIRMHLKSAA